MKLFNLKSGEHRVVADLWEVLIMFFGRVVLQGPKGHLKVLAVRFRLSELPRFALERHRLVAAETAEVSQKFG